MNSEWVGVAKDVNNKIVTGLISTRIVIPTYTDIYR